MYPTLKLKSGKETNAAYRHPWIFSGALAEIPPEAAHGDLVQVVDSGGKTAGVGTFSAKSSIAVRLFEFGEAVIDGRWLAGKLKEADETRRLNGFGPDSPTNGYRLVFGEADGLPGLVVDRYADVLVIQVSTAGMEKMRDLVIAALVEVFRPRAIVERSDLPSRREEGLDEVIAVRHGTDPGIVEFKENGWQFVADVMAGQKTGFFLDQRDLRRRIAGLASGRRCLNLFSYTGAAAVAAMKGGAVSVHNVDSSKGALELCLRQAGLNGLPAVAVTTEEADIFQFLGVHSQPEYDMVIMDPPALIKSRHDADEGRKAYHFLNRAALRLVRDGGIFVTSSCSHYLPEEDMAFILRRASLQAGCRLSVIDIVHQSSDHPRSVYFPEAAYLKSFVCQIRRLAA